MTFTRDSLYPFLIIGTVFLASGQSEIQAPDFGITLDKAAHFAVFGALATSIVRLPRFRVSWRGALAALALVSLYGALDEWRQSFTPGRSVEFDDWLADTLGALAAVVLYRGLPPYRRLLEWKP